MAKQKYKVRVSWCIACHATDKTLYKMNKDIRMCKDCKNKLANTGRLDICDNGGTFVISNPETGQVDYLPPEQKEVPQDGNRAEVSTNGESSIALS